MLKGRLEAAGLRWSGAGGGPEPRVELALAVEGAGAERRRRGAPPPVRPPPRSRKGAACCWCPAWRTLGGLEADLRLTAQMRSVAQIAPAVAHDLRAPINAMVFNIEILKEMLASGRATDPANKDKLLRYTSVLKEELSRLHRGLETFLLYISPRGDREETFDLRELAEELAALLVAPARKQQAQVRTELPEGAVPVAGNRYLLRQALLHLALAALAGVPRQGALHVLLDRRGRPRPAAPLRGGGRGGSRERAGPAVPAGDGARRRPRRPDSSSASRRPARRPSSGWRARSSPRWAAKRGPPARRAETPPGVAQAYEVELPISENPGNGNQGVS